MFDSLNLPFVQRGLLEIAALSVAAGLLGTWIVLRGLAFFTHAVGTAAFPGLVLADGLGFAAVVGAFGTAAIVAASVGWLARRDRDGYDALTALVLVAALAIGVILASDVFGSGSNIESLLFGSLLATSTADIALAATASVLALIATVILGTRWLATGFDASAASAQGQRSAAPDAVLLALVAFTAVAALSSVGALLATALLVVPAATTRLVCRRMATWQVATVGLVLLEGTAGLLVSVQTNAPPGATIAVLGGAVFLLVALGRALASFRTPRAALAVVAGIAAVGAGCGGDDEAGSSGSSTTTPAAEVAKPVEVVATTTVLGDLARQVGGDAVKVTQILQPNADAHDYEPRPDDVKATAGAEVVFVSGDNLDAWMGDVVEQAGGNPAVADLSQGLPARLPGEEEGEEASEFDPHWWHDPANVKHAVGAIRDALVKARPQARAAIESKATAYLAKVATLERGIVACLDAVPQGARKLVTDHDAFGYYAGRFGIDVVGAVIPSQTTQAQPSSGELSKLSRTIRAEGVKAVFPEESLNPRLAKAIAKQTGATADFTLYGDSLGPAGSPGATYLQMERANTDQMVRGFTGGSEGCTIRGL